MSRPPKAPRSRARRGAPALGLLLLAAVALPSLVGAPAHAQRKRISLDEIVIEGNIQKPEAFFILPRTSLNFEDLERREDLKRRIIESIEKAPF